MPGYPATAIARLSAPPLSASPSPATSQCRNGQQAKVRPCCAGLAARAPPSPTIYPAHERAGCCGGLEGGTAASGSCDLICQIVLSGHCCCLLCRCDHSLLRWGELLCFWSRRLLSLEHVAVVACADRCTHACQPAPAVHQGAVHGDRLGWVVLVRHEQAHPLAQFEAAGAAHL